MSSICMWRFQNSTPSLNRKHKRWLRRKTNHKICFAEDCYRFFFLLSFFQPTAHLRYFGQDSYKSNWTGLFYNSKCWWNALDSAPSGHMRACDAHAIRTSNNFGVPALERPRNSNPTPDPAASNSHNSQDVRNCSAGWGEKIAMFFFQTFEGFKKCGKYQKASEKSQNCEKSHAVSSLFVFEKTEANLQFSFPSLPTKRPFPCNAVRQTAGSPPAGDKI